jgi:hypothetical protein
MHIVWTFGYMASYLGAHLVDVNGVAARGAEHGQLRRDLVLTNKSDTVDRAVCDVEVLRERSRRQKGCEEVTCEGQKRFLRDKCLFTGFVNGASTAPVMWLRCLPEGTGHSVGAVHRGRKWSDANRKLLPGRHYSPVHRHCIAQLNS